MRFCSKLVRSILLLLLLVDGEFLLVVRKKSTAWIQFNNAQTGRAIIRNPRTHSNSFWLTSSLSALHSKLQWDFFILFKNWCRCLRVAFLYSQRTVHSFACSNSAVRDLLEGIQYRAVVEIVARHDNALYFQLARVRNSCVLLFEKKQYPEIDRYRGWWGFSLLQHAHFPSIDCKASLTRWNVCILSSNNIREELETLKLRCTILNRPYRTQNGSKNKRTWTIDPSAVHQRYLQQLNGEGEALCSSYGQVRNNKHRDNYF